MFLTSLDLVNKLARTDSCIKTEIGQIVGMNIIWDWEGYVRNSFVWSLSKARSSPKLEASLDLRTFETKYDSMLVLSPKEGLRVNFRESVVLKIFNKNKVYNLNNNCYYFRKFWNL